YSTCHWCHVMESESFEDEEIAAYLNGNYVAIKVDREQRPDINAIYMSAGQMMTGQGGWPMTAGPTPPGEAFYGGTSFPARSGARPGRVGLLAMLQKLRQAYDERPDQVAAAARDIADRLSAQAAEASPSAPFDAPASIRSAIEADRRSFDADNGGF